MRTFDHRLRPSAPSSGRSIVPSPDRLAVSSPGDRYEREASDIADAVVRAPRAQAEEARPLQNGAPLRGPHPEAVPSVVRSPGHGLEPSLRADAQSHLGFDFSHVRVHADSAAAESAQAFSANAYTYGEHIVFGAGQFRPATPSGRRLLAHELAHVAQQTSTEPAGRSSRAPNEETGGPDRIITRSAVPMRMAEPMIQRDLAIEPPRPEAEGRVLTAAQMAAAIAFNERVIGAVGVGVLSEVRDVLGVDAEPAVIDEEFVNAVVRWQAMYRLPQDGRLGPGTAAPLFREIGAEDVGRGALVSGPTYTPGGTIAATTAGGVDSATFRFSAEFEEDPENGIFPSCCEVEQWIRWDAAAAASWGGGPPHGGFPAATAPDTWIEDRDDANTRYGRRSGPQSAPANGDEYLDATGARNQAFGQRYRGRDSPSGPATLAGQWRFMVQVVDVCHGRTRIGTPDFIRVNW